MYKSLRLVIVTLTFITLSMACAQTSFPVEKLTGKSGKEIDLRLFKHASLAVDFDGTSIYVDPVTKVGDTAIDYSAMPKADFILITHEHGDHLDPAAIEQLSKQGTRVIANATSAAKLGFGEVMKNYETKQLTPSIKIESVAAYNTTPGREKFHPKGNGNGYILDIDGKRIYIAGDTEVIAEMSDIKNIDVAFLPVNQPYTMTVEQAEKAAAIIKPKVLVPYHFSDTPIEELKRKLDDDNSGIEVKIYPME